MVKRSFIGLFIIPILLLSACTQKVLRSDIQEFIASFSLSESIKEYKEAGYTLTQNVSFDGVESTSTKKIDFNIKDESNISYSYSYVEIENKEVKTNDFVKITTENNKYFLESNSVNKHEIDVEEVNENIIKFFYETDEYEFHKYGAYYGDIVLDSAYTFQNYTTIDEENKLYKVEYETKSKDQDITISEKLVVNSLGMLESNYVKATSSKGESVSTWVVYKK